MLLKNQKKNQILKIPRKKNIINQNRTFINKRINLQKFSKKISNKKQKILMVIRTNKKKYAKYYNKQK